MKNFIKKSMAGLLAVGFISTSVFAADYGNVEDYVNEGNVVFSGGYILHDDIEDTLEEMEQMSDAWSPWTSISSGRLTGTWRHRMTSNLVQAETMATNGGQSQAITINSSNRNPGPWASHGQVSSSSIARTLSGNRSGWDLRER